MLFFGKYQLVTIFVTLMNVEPNSGEVKKNHVHSKKHNFNHAFFTLR